jgi:hypothetical protein
MSYSPFADDFLDMLAQTITLSAYLGVTGNGTRSYGPAKIYHAQITSDSKAIYSATGQVVFSTSVIIFHPKATDSTVLTAITPDAKIVLPDGTSPRILQIGSAADETGGTVYFEIRT